MNRMPWIECLCISHHEFIELRSISASEHLISLNGSPQSGSTVSPLIHVVRHGKNSHGGAAWRNTDGGWPCWMEVHFCLRLFHALIFFHQAVGMALPTSFPSGTIIHEGILIAGNGMASHYIRPEPLVSLWHYMLCMRGAPLVDRIPYAFISFGAYCMSLSLSIQM